VIKGLLLLAAMIPSTVLAVALPKNEPVPGGVIVLELPASTTTPVAHFDGHRIMVVKHADHWYGVAGIPLATAAGETALTVKIAQQPVLQVKFSIQPKQYPEQRLVIKNPKLVNPPASELDRIEREQRHLERILNAWVPDKAPGLSFIWPADGPQTSGFGLRRFYNGEEGSRHMGIDIGAAAGTPVRAPADGVVADEGHYYFCGHTLTISLGQGLYSVFCHMNKISVRRGQTVKQGEFVGTIGATGRTTGPNLHWTVSLNGTPVDPHAFIPANAIPVADRQK